MTKMTYGEQLRHPNWQRLRLERLSEADWKCQSCGSGETTLHVHHRRYIKGRMAWEYPPENFSVLCEQCHAFEHELNDKIQLTLANVPVGDTIIAAGLLAGYFYEDLDPGSVSDACAPDEPHSANIGFAARKIADSAGMSTVQVAQLASALQAEDFVAFVLAELRRRDDEMMAEVMRDLQAKPGSEG